MLDRVRTRLSLRPRSLRLVLLAGALGVIGLGGGTSCSIYACLIPPELPTAGEIASSDARYPAEPVEVIVDDELVPHIFGQSPTDVAYAVGFMHGKDRQLQLWGFRQLLFGRGTEAFGEDFLSSDQQTRLITYGIDEQLADADAWDYDMLEAVSAGVNDGVAYAGPTLAMRARGFEFEPWQPRDTLAIIRFVGWSLSSGFQEEFGRMRLAEALETTDPRYDELYIDGSSMGRPVVRAEEHDGEENFPWPWLNTGGGTSSGMSAGRAPPAWAERRATDEEASADDDPLEELRAQDQPEDGRTEAERERAEWGREFQRMILGHPEVRGASNAWAVKGDRTTTGRAIFSHDPHLSHGNPSTFYLAHIEGPGFKMAGATFPGGPVVALGHGEHIVWGTPYAPVDVMDAVRIVPVEGKETEAYWLDGEEEPFEKLTQEYRDGDGEIVHTEEWLITRFGPVLPEPFRELYPEGETYALMWTGHRPIEGSGAIMRGFWDLGLATTPDEAEAAIQKITNPALNMTMAFSNGDIAWRLVGDVPVRWSDEPATWPRDGTSSRAGWAGRLPPEYKPRLTNPASGYIVAANQAIVDPDGPAYEVFRDMGSPPFRALRIDERIRELLDEGDVTPQEIWDIQQDAVDYTAVRLAPLFAANCPEETTGDAAELLDAVCSRLESWDGEHTLETEAALPFAILREFLKREMLELHLGPDIAGQVSGMVDGRVFEAWMRAEAGEEPAILDDPETDEYEGLEGLIAKVMPAVLTELKERGTDQPAQWRWGNHHYRVLEGPIADAVPGLGPLMYRSANLEETGCRACPRAENSSGRGNIRSGAVIRIHGDASDPMLGKVTIDVGQSGEFGHWAYDSQYERWRNNDPGILMISREEALAKSFAHVSFVPKPE